ncbi:hypothetical protein V6D40_05250 [Corynebacterium sp. Q4381]|uniref:hypothetical protein n=1 Tax=Corynebacterium sp. Marseille-Q4381 TaxID=3121597 RepID=UPI002FE506FD
MTYPTNTITAQELQQENEVYGEKDRQNKERRASAWMGIVSALIAIAAIVALAIYLWQVVPNVTDTAGDVRDAANEVSSQAR